MTCRLAAASHYLNRCGIIVNWTLRNKLQWHFNRNSKSFVLKNAFENVVCKMAFILSLPQCVNTHKIHPIPRPSGRTMGCLLWAFEKIYRVIVASHCILRPHLWYNPYDTRPYKSLCADSHANGVDEQVGFMYTLCCVIILFSSTRQLPFTSQVFTKQIVGQHGYTFCSWIYSFYETELIRA